MKKWLIATILAFVLSLSGIGESQVKSQFPKLDKLDAVTIDLRNCTPNQLFSITLYHFDDSNGHTDFYVYESGSTLFAIAKFLDEKFIGVYVLLSNKSVMFYKDSDPRPSVCKALDALNLDETGQNTF
jgi:hypothetical protein